MYFNIQFFYLLSFLICFCGFAVIFSKNPIHSILFLVFLFFNSSCLLILLGADFLAILFLIVYVGAVAVLFLFVIMMLSGKFFKIKINFFYIPLVLLLVFIFLFNIFLIVNKNINFLSNNIVFLITILNPMFCWEKKVFFQSNIELVGLILYSYFFYFFIVCAIFLLVSMIGAIVLNLYKKNDLKTQFVYKQIKKNFEKTIFLKKI